MDEKDVDFLRCYLEAEPKLKDRLRLAPPAILDGGRWMRIQQVKPRPTGLDLILRSGRRLHLRTSEAGVGNRLAGPILELLKVYFPGARIVSTLRHTDRQRHHTAALLRVLFEHRRLLRAVVAAFPDEPGESRERLLSSLLLWHEKLRRRPVKEFLILVPEKWGDALLRILPLLNLQLRCFRYRIKEGVARMEQVYPSSPAIIGVSSPYVLMPFRASVPAPISSLLDSLEGDYPALRVHLRGGRWELGYCGLPLAWQVRQDRQIWFDPVRPQPYSPEQHSCLKEMIERAQRLRSFPPPLPRHPFFTWRPERWLESLVLEDPRMIEPRFEEVIYSQVPTCVDGKRKVLDLLTCTPGGRLSVIELKVTKDLDLIFQALEYWERVCLHAQRRDFQRQGYFAGRRLSPKRPRLYLVAPLFDYHRLFPVFRRHLSPRVRFHCVGINANWRQKLQILRRFQW